MIDLSVGDAMTMRGGNAAALGRIDQYELVRELGGGGFGCVYLARDTVAGIDVAVKGLPPEVKHNKEELENIRQNFALVSRLHHPNIAAALVLHPAVKAEYSSRDVMEKLRVFERDTMMVMEYAPGVTLSQWRKQFLEKKVPFEKTLAITRQVAAALDYAHGEKIVHRDVKPSNVVVETREDGSVVARVLDFGLAAEIRSSMGRVSREIRDTSGTRPYMAPEQWRGAKQGPATDQYALAAMFCELVTGEVPFASVFDTGDPVLMKTAVATDAPEFPKEMPKSVRFALSKALSKKPEERFATCTAFADALGRARAPRIAPASQLASLGGYPAAPLKWIAASVLLLSLAAVGGWWWRERVKSEELRVKNEALAAERARQVEERRQAEESKRAEETRVAAEKAEAERKVKAEAERIAEENRKAEELKIAAERAAETEVFRLSSKAESAHTLIERENAEVKAFFNAEIRAFENDRRAGDDAKRLSKNIVATNFFAQALAKATVLKALVDGRASCLIAKATAERARKAADEMGAGTMLVTRYGEARGKISEAAQAAESKNFERANACYAEASKLFVALHDDIVKAKKARLAEMERFAGDKRKGEETKRAEDAWIVAEKAKAEQKSNAKAAERIRFLDSLRGSGIITDAEYRSELKKIEVAANDVGKSDSDAASKVVVEQMPKLPSTSLLKTRQGVPGDVALEVKFKTFDRSADITIEWYVLLNSRGKKAEAPYVFLTSEHTYQSVKQGDYLAIATIPEGVRNAYGEAQAVGIVFRSIQGKILGGRTVSEIKGIKDDTMFWSDNRIMKAQDAVGRPMIVGKTGLRSLLRRISLESSDDSSQ